MNQILREYAKTPRGRRRIEAVLRYLEHGSHDQSDHGNWARGQKQEPSKLRRLTKDDVAALRAKRKAKAIYEAEKEIHNLDKEQARIFDDNGNVIATVQGDADKVTFTKEQLAMMRGKTMTHNHPGKNMSLSIDDGVFMIANGLKEIRAVHGNSVYSLSVAEGKLPPTPQEFKVSLERHVNDVVNGLRQQVIKGDITVDVAHRKAMHETWKRVAADTGLVYRLSGQGYSK